MDYRFEVSTTTVDGKKQYVVRYLDFSNLIGVGDTIEEAIKEAEGNLDFYIEYCKDSNIKIPNPTKVDDMDFSGKVTLRMSKDIHKEVYLLAEREGVSLNSLLNEAVITYIAKKSTVDYVEPFLAKYKME